MIRDPPVTVEPFQFSPAEPVAYEWSEDHPEKRAVHRKSDDRAGAIYRVSYNK